MFLAAVFAACASHRAERRATLGIRAERVSNERASNAQRD